MKYQFLELQVNDHILLITLSREDQLNALSVDMIREIREVFQSSIIQNENIKGVVLTGKGTRAFAAGADIKELYSLDQKESQAVSQAGHRTFDMIENFNIPVIAAINGYSLGGGLELALACHIRIAHSGARLGLPESSLGLIPGYGGTQRMTSLVGRAKAIELMCSGELIDAEQALELGLVSYVTEPGEEVAKAIEIIHKMTQYSRESTQKILEATRRQIDGFHYEYNAFAEILQTDNAKEGMAAFMEKRKPQFK